MYNYDDTPEPHNSFFRHQIVVHNTYSAFDQIASISSAQLFDHHRSVMLQFLKKEEFVWDVKEN